MIFRRCAVLVSTLALVAAFLAAPYEHVHTDTDVRHAHATPHAVEHQHGAPEGPGQQPHGHEDVVGTTAYLASGPAAAAPIDAVLVSPVSLIDIERTPHNEDPEQPRVHDPPPRPRSPRAPPVLPAL